MDIHVELKEVLMEGNLRLKKYKINMVRSGCPILEIVKRKHYLNSPEN